jgi:tetratricopeptide (TPR) repeat protein
MSLAFEKVRAAMLAAVRGGGSSWNDAYLDALSRRALRAFERGAVPDAEACCLYVLGRNPAQGRALECAGAIAARRRDWDTANARLRDALTAAPNDAGVLARLADVTFALGDVGGAMTFASRVLAQDPGNTMALFTQGRALSRRGDFAAAVGFLQRAADRLDQDPVAWSELGTARLRLSQLNEARDCFVKVLALDPTAAEAHVSLGDIYLAAGHAEDARSNYRQALRIAPDSVRALSRLGAASAQAGDAADAERLLSQATDLAPGELEPLINLGLLNQEAGRTDQALECYRRARAIDPICVEAHMYAGLAHLSRGELAEGWDGLEWRLRLPSLQYLRDVDRPLWRGESIAGSTILLQAEPGVSDHIQFLRYVPELVAQGARVVVETFPEMQRLVGRTPKVQGTVSGNEESARVAEKVEWRCPILSLPHRFRTTARTIPSTMPYFVTDPAGVAGWRARLKDLPPGPRIGFTWAEGPAPLDAMIQMFGNTKASFVCLQPVPPGARPLPGLVDWTASIRDFADLADLIAALDVMIGPPAPVTHLSGALGKPTWMLVRPGGSDWRWAGDSSTTNWYPTVRVFRHKAPGVWPDAAAALAGLRPS